MINENVKKNADFEISDWIKNNGIPKNITAYNTIIIAMMERFPMTTLTEVKKLLKPYKP